VADQLWWPTEDAHDDSGGDDDDDDDTGRFIRLLSCKATDMLNKGVTMQHCKFLYKYQS